METTDRPYLPAAGYHFALALYDPFTRLLGVDGLRTELISHAALQPGERVLDVGCGTGSLVIAAKRACPHATIHGVDPDPRALELARRKAARAGVDVHFERGYGDALPFDDGTFAHVFSSFMLHHLDPNTQLKLLTEVRRVLQPKGSFHLVDLTHAGHKGHGLFRRLHHAGPQPHVQSHDAVGEMLQRAGFCEVSQPPLRRLFWTSVLCYRARTPDAV